MKRTFPDRNKIQFLVCEQVRLEQHKKVSVIGWYTGDEIVFQPGSDGKPPKLPLRMAALSFVFVLKDGAGKFQSALTVIDPQGNVAVKPAALGPVKLDGKSHLIGVHTIAPAFQSVGKYTVVLELDKTPYEFPLKISKQNKRATPTP